MNRREQYPINNSQHIGNTVEPELFPRQMEGGEITFRREDHTLNLEERLIVTHWPYL